VVYEINHQLQNEFSIERKPDGRGFSPCIVTLDYVGRKDAFLEDILCLFKGMKL
jgi:hypothetical protein